LPRCAALWGQWGSTNQDGRVHILLTPLLNEEDLAVGFFNPAQDNTPGNSFSTASLCATIAHELTHLIHYERKTRQAAIAGSADPPQEETFLDEGLAQLSECLNGYGVSGGDILFAQKYLSSPAVRFPTMAA
jgi:hypothetical protein